MRLNAIDLNSLINSPFCELFMNLHLDNCINVSCLIPCKEEINSHHMDVERKTEKSWTCPWLVTNAGRPAARWPASSFMMNWLHQQHSLHNPQHGNGSLHTAARIAGYSTSRTTYSLHNVLNLPAFQRPQSPSAKLSGPYSSHSPGTSRTGHWVCVYVLAWPSPRRYCHLFQTQIPLLTIVKI